MSAVFSGWGDWGGGGGGRGVGDQKKIKQTCGKGDAIVLFLLWHLK